MVAKDLTKSRKSTGSDPFVSDRDESELIRMSVTGESISVDPKKIGIVSKPNFFSASSPKNSIFAKNDFFVEKLFFADHPKTIQQKSGALMDEI